MADNYTDITPAYRDFRPGDVKHSLAGFTKARERIGYNPEFSVLQGLDNAADCYFKYLS